MHVAAAVAAPWSEGPADWISPGYDDDVFTEGRNPILYDLGIVMGVDPADPDAGTPSFASHEPTRWAMGDTCRFAGRIDLPAATPAPAVSSTGFALVQPGAEYLVLAPDGAAEPFTVRVADLRAT